MSGQETKMFINAREAEEIRVAVLEGGVLEEYFVERSSDTKARKGSIYVGKVSNVDSGLQAAFVDLGEGPQGFLSISDVKYPDGGFSNLLRGSQAKKKMLKGEVDIRKVLRKGQKVVVQVLRESMNSKGPSLTTYISVPGRFLVLIPQAPEKTGISRRIEDPKERKRLKTIIRGYDAFEKHGFIVRTASSGCTKQEITSDLASLTNIWKGLEKEIRRRSAPTPRAVYRDSDLLLRTFRDVYSIKINKVFVDSRQAFDKIVGFMKGQMPHKVKALQLTETRKPLFEKYNIEEQIQSIFDREVPLANGGSVVIEQTEAMIAIDVNSGTYHNKRGQEYIALETNLIACEVIARQIRFRDLGGLICIDFIDMQDKKNRRKIEDKLKKSVKRDKARIDILPISEFGILEMTRQRERQNIINVNYSKCPVCRGLGQIKSKQTLALEIFRNIKNRISGRNRRKKESETCKTVSVTAHPRMAEYLLNEMRGKLTGFKNTHSIRINVLSSYDLHQNEIRYK